MSEKVVVVGWAKTGTTSLAAALDILGYNHLAGPRFDLVDHWIRDRTPRAAIARLRNYDSCDDWPYTLLYSEIDSAYPGTKFILTTRDPASWLESYRHQLSLAPDRKSHERRRFLYGLPFPDVTDDELVDRVRAHNEAVRSYFEECPDRPLELDLAASDDNWRRLCDFLDKTPPAAPFPRENVKSSRSRGRGRHLSKGALARIRRRWRTGFE